MSAPSSNSPVTRGWIPCSPNQPSRARRSEVVARLAKAATDAIADPEIHDVVLTTEEEGVALLAGADLGGANLNKADLRRADLASMWAGQGVALAGLYGKLMAEAIRGTAERFAASTSAPVRSSCL